MLPAAGTARRRNRGTAAARSGRAPRQRSGRAPPGCAPPAAASAAACAVRDSSSCGSCGEHRGAASQAAIVVDHAEAADHAELRILHLPLLRLAGELADGFHHAEESACRARLARGELAAAGVEREVAVPGEAV